jgi:hypothetical protein
MAKRKRASTRNTHPLSTIVQLLLAVWLLWLLVKLLAFIVEHLFRQRYQELVLPEEVLQEEGPQEEALRLEGLQAEGVPTEDRPEEHTGPEPKPEQLDTAVEMPEAEVPAGDEAPETASPERDYLAAGVWWCPAGRSGAPFVGSVMSDAFHTPGCMSVSRIGTHTRICYESREVAIAYGKRPCEQCTP